MFVAEKIMETRNLNKEIAQLRTKSLVMEDVIEEIRNIAIKEGSFQEILDLTEYVRLFK